MNHHGCDAVAESDADQYTKKAGFVDCFRQPLPSAIDAYKWIPRQQVSNQKDEKSSFEDLTGHLAMAHSSHFGHGECHGIAHRKKEGREDKVCWREAMPGSMLKGFKRS